MNNEDNTSGRPLDMNQLKWALRHGQKIAGLDNIMRSNQPIMLTDTKKENNSVVEIQNAMLEEEIDQLGQSFNREIVSMKGEFQIVAQDTDVEERIDQLGQSLNQEILSLKSELQNVAQGTAVEEQIDHLGQALNQQILTLKSEFANVAQDTAVEERIDQLGESLNQEFLSVKSEFVNVAQSMVLTEQLDKLEQHLNQKLSSLKSELEVVAQGTVFKDQIIKLGKYIDQEIVSFHNEFVTFIQTQLDQEKAWRIAEFEWKDSLKNRDAKLQADMQEMQHKILGKIDEHFQYVDEQRQHNDNMLRQQVCLLTAQLEAIQQVHTIEEEVRKNDFWGKMDERQTRLIEDVIYIQYVVEEIATRPICIEAQQKLRENFFIRELAALKEEMASVCKKCQSSEKGCMIADAQQYNKGVSQEQERLESDDQTKIYTKKKKRRY